MHSALKTLSVLYTASRAYSVPISVMSWLVPFLIGVINGGSVYNGLLALLGIVVLHLGTNSFDDAVDYTVEKYAIDSGKSNKFNFQEGKCICIFKGLLSLKQYYILAIGLFICAFAVGMYFLIAAGFKLLFILIPAAFLCILYPVLGSLGFGEIIVAVIFSPLIYSGVYYVMTGEFSSYILLLSLSTGLLSVAVLHNHMLLDYKLDCSARKITLCRLCKSEKNALILLAFMIILAYLNLVVCFILGKIDFICLLPLLTLPQAFVLLNVMKKHVENSQENIKYNILMGPLKSLERYPEEERGFMLKFLLPQNLLTSFTILLCIAVIADKFC